MVNKVNVLIFPAGAVNAIEIYDSLKYNIHFNIYGATSIHDHSEYIYPKDMLIIDNFYISNEQFEDKFNTLLMKYNIDYIIPTHDVISAYLTKCRKKINARVVCSPYETAKIAENKYLMYKALKEYDFLPKVYAQSKDIDNYPIFIKPFIGAGGKNSHKIKDSNELERLLSDNSEMIICEYLPGREFTVDCFTNQNGELLFIGPRTRENISMGITFHSERVEYSMEIEAIAYALNNKFVFSGAWFFQVKEDRAGKLKLMEFSVRQAGTMALYRQLGINFAALTLFDAMGYDVKVLYNDYNIKLNRSIKPSYYLDYSYSKVYIDLDDTIIVNNKVNTLLIKFIYQCINQNKQVILITKHKYDLDETLRKHRISKEIFDLIILVDNKKNKSDFIDKSNAIFIDNYFPERVMVKEKCNIPVFDVDAIECLIRDNEI